MAEKTTYSKSGLEKRDSLKPKKEKGRIGGKTLILFMIFGISLLPLVLSPFENLFIQRNDYSIFNNGLKGTSIFYYKIILDCHDIPLTITSSLNSLYMLPSENTILVELGPVQFFDPFEIMTLINFISNGGKLLLASNFGTGSELTLLNNIMGPFFIDPIRETLYNLFLNFTLTGFNVSTIIYNPLFTDPNLFRNFISNELTQKSPKFSFWIDNNIYSSPIYENNPSNTVPFMENILINELPFGIVVNNIQSPFNDGVNKILLTRPTPLSLGTDFGMAGLENLLVNKSDPTSPISPYFAINLLLQNLGINMVVNNSYDYNSAILKLFNFYNISTTTVIAQTSSTSYVDTNSNYFFDLMDYNGSFWISALSDNKRVILVTQPQIFTNLFYFINKYDNAKFAMNLFNNLTGNTPHFVVFDETKQQKAFPSFFGLILRFINASSGILLLIPILPLLTYAMLSRWIPKIEKPKIYKKSKIVKTKGKSIFSERMRWYKEKRQYNTAISLLYRRLKRSIVKSLELKNYDPKVTIEVIKKIKPNVNIVRFQYNLNKFERIEKNQIHITNQYSFLETFNEMKWCYDQVK